MTEQHAAETDYDQQYIPHGNGEYHHVPQADIPATVVKLSDPSPRQHRAWPLTARLAVAVLVIALATVTAMALVTIHSVSARQSRTDTRVSELYGVVGLNATQSSQASSKTGGSVSSLQTQLSAVEAQLAALAGRLSHHGVCLVTATNNNGLMVSVNLSTPVMVSGNDSCPSGVFVSAVPTRR